MPVTEPTALLERGDALEQLNAGLERVRLGSGRVVLVDGEDGIGKTALVRRFAETHESEIRVVWGTCDALFTPRPLAPVREIAQGLESWSHERPATDAERSTFVQALVDDLGSRSTIAVMDDLHRADGATLDAVEFLTRNITSAPVLLVLTYRDGGGEVYGERVPLESLDGPARISLSPLSADGVAAMASHAQRSVHGLHEATGGNPFFVTEVLAGEGGDVPPTVEGAVLARASRLSPGANRLLEAASVVPGSIEIWMLEALAGEDFVHFAECLSTGMLVPTSAGVALRHEIARLAVEHSLASDRRVSLNDRALQALAAGPDRRHDLGALTHHADAAGDAHAVLRFAPMAAAEAARMGAHREAAEHYARALSYHPAPDQVRLALLESYATELDLTGRSSEAQGVREEMATLRSGVLEP